MKPTAAPPYFPYRSHRSMKQVLRDERLGEFRRLPNTLTKGRTVGQFGGGV